MAKDDGISASVSATCHSHLQHVQDLRLSGLKPNEPSGLQNDVLCVKFSRFGPSDPEPVRFTAVRKEQEQDFCIELVDESVNETFNLMLVFDQHCCLL